MIEKSQFGEGPEFTHGVSRKKVSYEGAVIEHLC